MPVPGYAPYVPGPLSFFVRVQVQIRVLRPAAAQQHPAVAGSHSGVQQGGGGLQSRGAPQASGVPVSCPTSASTDDNSWACPVGQCQKGASGQFQGLAAVHAGTAAGQDLRCCAHLHCLCRLGFPGSAQQAPTVLFLQALWQVVTDEKL